MPRILRDVAVEDLAFVDDRSPQVMAFAVDLHEYLVEAPAPLAKAVHPAHPLATDVGSEHRAEPVPPQPHGFMADIAPTLEEQVFDIPQAQRETHIHQHREANDLGL